MNFLAHLYLSGNSDNVRFGNLIGDSIKGKNYLKFPEDISRGILLHRRIDAFTDSNKIVKECKPLFVEKYHKYSGVVVDIVFDHFLAINWSKYSNHDLHAFSRHAYAILVKNYSLIPSRIKFFMAFMIVNNWLESYKKIEFIRKVFNRMPYRTSLPNEPDFVINTIENNYQYLNEQFDKFFIEIKKYVSTEFNIVFDYNEFKK